jgi:chromosome segregation ATPase
VVKAREQRVNLLRDELKSLDARMETRVDSLVDALTAIGDSKDSKTKVARMKEKTMTALNNSINYYQNKRASMQEELRRPTLNLTEEQKRRASPCSTRTWRSASRKFSNCKSRCRPRRTTTATRRRAAIGGARST